MDMWLRAANNAATVTTGIGCDAALLPYPGFLYPSHTAETNVIQQ